MSKAPASDVARTLLGWIEADREEIVRFLSAFVAAPSPNPPGDTRPAAAVAVDLLKAKGVPHEVKAAKPELPNVVGSVAGGAAGRHPHVRHPSRAQPGRSLRFRRRLRRSFGPPASIVRAAGPRL